MERINRLVLCPQHSPPTAFPSLTGTQRLSLSSLRRIMTLPRCAPSATSAPAAPISTPTTSAPPLRECAPMTNNIDNAGETIADRVAAFMRRYVVFTDQRQADILALWAI